MSTFIYKIADAGAWGTARTAGQFVGSADDMRDGFIHFSTAAQAAETARRHFAGRDGLVIAAVTTERLGEALRWEPSRGGDLFPHLYAALDMSAVIWTRPLPLDANGMPVLPPEVV